MKMTRSVGTLLVAFVSGGMLCGSGCSSSSKGGGESPGGEDSGTHSDSGSGGTDSSTTAHDSGSAASDSSSPSGGDAGTQCSAPGSTSSFTPATYVAAVPHQGVCTAGQITTFVGACGFDNGSPTACASWQSTNVGADAGSNAPCGNCILSPQNNGGLWLDPEGMNMAYNGLPNYAGCIQIMDPTHGTACATAFNNVDACEGVACDTACMNATADNAFTNCANTVIAGSCATYNTAQTMACSTDFDDAGDPSATVAACFPAANSGDPDDDYTYILTLICGSGTGDAGGQ